MQGCENRGFTLSQFCPFVLNETKRKSQAHASTIPINSKPLMHICRGHRDSQPEPVIAAVMWSCSAGWSKRTCK